MTQKSETRYYHRHELIVAWHPSLCSHSANCWKGLPQGFKPREKQWINVQGADANQII